MKYFKKILLSILLTLAFFIPVFSNTNIMYADSCTPFVHIGAHLGMYNGWHIVKFSHNGVDAFCLDGAVFMNNTNNCSEYYNAPYQSDASYDVAKAIIVYNKNKSDSLYLETQKYIWGCRDSQVSTIMGLIESTDLSDNYHTYKISFSPNNPYALGAEFTLSDSNGNFGNHSSKYNISNVSPGLDVSRSGNSIQHKITQPYPLVKTVTISGKTEGGAYYNKYTSNQSEFSSTKGQDFATLGSADVHEYIGTSYNIKMPTGSLFFQKKDSFDNNVYNNYCRDTHLCTDENADATNNTFRLLIDNASPYWGTNADTGVVVNAKGKTFHIFQLENGVSYFQTNASGQIALDGLLIGHYYLQEVAVNESVFILNDELVEFNINASATTNASMKNINLFGDIDLQKYDEFTNAGLNNTYNNNASGNGFKFKYIETLGRPIFEGKTFNLSEGTIKINDDNYLEIDGESVFYTNSNGYIHTCSKFTSTNNLCVPFGSWKMEEVAVQNEFELNDTIVDFAVDVGEKTSLDFTNDYRDVTLKIYKQDKANEEMVEGATYAFYDIDKYNIGDTSKGKGNLYGDKEKETFNSNVELI